MSYLIDKKYLFVGDSMSLEDGRVALFNEFFNMDSETQGETLRKLAGLSGVEYVFTAHYGAIFTIPVHAGVSIWEVGLMGIGFKRAGSLSWVGSLILGVIVKAVVYIPLAVIFIR